MRRPDRRPVNRHSPSAGNAHLDWSRIVQAIGISARPGLIAMQHPGMFDLLNRCRKARILVLGDVMLDRFVYGTVERISPEAPIPVLSIERLVNMPGGAANV